MIGFLFKIGLSLVVLLLVYNYFLGTPEEKSNSKEIISEVIHLGKSSWELLRTEKQKLSEGKYDLALDKVSRLLDGLENEVEKSGDPKIEEQFQELTNQRDELIKMEQSSRDTESSSGGTSLMTEKEKAERLKLLKTLLSETELLMNELEHK
jgi:hypothetical protein